MNMIDIIKTRKSIRTFDGRELTDEDKEKICAYIKTIANPYNIPVEFVLLDSKEHDLSSPVIVGENIYIAAKVPKTKHCEEAFGYSFEKMVLYAWSIGIGTTWIGGTMKREVFEKAAKTGENEIMMIVSPLGYPSKEKSEIDKKLRNSVHGDDRLPSDKLFFDGDFFTPLVNANRENWAEAVRWAPSAANMQPWRVVKDGNKFHFYEKHTEGYNSGAGWDVQRIDIGIAICHFMSVMDGELKVEDPDINVTEDTEYIATIII